MNISISKDGNVVAICSWDSFIADHAKSLVNYDLFFVRIGILTGLPYQLKLADIGDIVVRKVAAIAATKLTT